MEERIRDLVRRCKPQSLILLYINNEFGVDMGKRCLQRYMRDHDIWYYRDESPQDVIQAIMAEQNSPRKNAGIRRVQFQLRTHYNLLVTRQQVWDIMTILNPGVLQRNRKGRLKRRAYYSEGSNFVWHVDQHDKVREFGIRIHACVDGFSRKILWLEASADLCANTVGRYFYDCIIHEDVVPSRIRADHGTENAEVAQMQICLRRNGTDEYTYDNSFKGGTSKYNQPVENMWSRFLEKHELYWIDTFNDLKRRGLWQYGVVVDRWCLLYVYLPLVKEGLQAYKSYANSHCIRRQNVMRPTAAAAEDIYKFPNNFGGRQMGYTPASADLAAIYNHFNLHRQQPDPIPSEVRFALDRFTTQRNLTINLDTAKDVYTRLRIYMNTNMQ